MTTMVGTQTDFVCYLRGGIWEEAAGRKYQGRFLIRDHQETSGIIWDHLGGLWEGLGEVSGKSLASFWVSEKNYGSSATSGISRDSWEVSGKSLASFWAVSGNSLGIVAGALAALGSGRIPEKYRKQLLQ